MAGEQLNKILLRVRSIDECLSLARINTVEIFEDTRNVRVTMICDKTVPDDVRAAVLNVFNLSLPQSFKNVGLVIKKIQSDEELVAREIFSYLKSNYKSVAHSITQSDITVEMPPKSQEIEQNSPRVIKFTVAVDKDVADRFSSSGTLQNVEAHLARNFCDDFRGEMQTKETETDFSILKEKPVQIDYTIYRTIKVADIVPIDDYLGTDMAIYIDDIAGPMDSVYLCGEILSVRERATSAGKPFYLIEFSDKTGKIVGTYFNKKTTEKKIRRLKEGDGIIINGSLDYFKDRLSLTIKKLNYCLFPKDFVPERKPSKPAPYEYSYVFPEPVTEFHQNDIFSAEKPPHESLQGKTFVVFDFETTGTEPTKDTVTEIGAVKIENGVITQKFTSLINPERKISPLITELTGIDNSMVDDKPPFSQVCGDIFKFFEGATLVAHNLDFDYKFLKVLSEAQGYFYYNKGIDTVQFSRDTVKGLSNYKLNTVCAFFGIEFLHHRALSDAYATAQMFIKLVEKNGGLPALQ